MLWRAQQQHLSSPSAGTKPCSSAKSRLKTQKEGQEDPEITTDVRDSPEVEKKEHDEPEATPSSRQDEDKFSKCECLESSLYHFVYIVHYFSVILFMK